MCPKYSFHQASIAQDDPFLKFIFFIEPCLKLIQFKIQFKQNPEYSFKKSIYSIESRIFNRITCSNEMRKIIQ